MQPSENTRFEALYDHYKDTFGRIRDREQRRDRLFLWLIGLLGVLFLFADYPQVIKIIGLAIPAVKVPDVDLCQRRSDMGPRWRCKKGPLGAGGLSP